MEKKCLLAAMLFYVGLSVCANTEDFESAMELQNAALQRIENRIVETIKAILSARHPEHIFTDAQIRAAFNSAQQTMTPAHIPAQRLQSVENDMRLDLAQHYPGRAFNDQEIREIALRGLQTQEAVRLLTSIAEAN